MLSSILNEVRRDAIQKSNSVNFTLKDMEELADTLAQVIYLSNICLKEGLLSLEEESSYIEENAFQQELIKKGIFIIVDGNESEIVEEYLTSLYWVRDPQGVEALASYCVIRGLCLIQLGRNPLILEALLAAAVPSECQKLYEEALKKLLNERNAKVRAEEAERYEKVTYVIRNRETAIVLKRLEGELNMMDDRSIQRLLRDVDSDTLVTAMTGLSGNTRDILFNNMSKRFKEMVISDFLGKFTCFMDVYITDEEEMKLSAEKILNIVERLVECGELPSIFTKILSENLT